MPTPHVFVEPADCADGRVILRDDVAHHVLTVLRRRAGDAVSVADGTGTVRRAVISSTANGTAVCSVTAETHAPSPSPAVRVVCGLPKRRKLDEVVQRLTELGVDEIVPTMTDRSQVRLEGARAQRTCDRWQSIARAAAEQSGRPRVPVVAAISTWAEVFAAPASGVVCWEEAATPLHATTLDATGGQVTVAVGPEGGLTADEIAVAGLPAAGLGPTIMRAETAAVVAPALVLHRLGRLG
jgi:16S rRNA (uracil1498-N3)-methyltransferase